MRLFLLIICSLFLLGCIQNEDKCDASAEGLSEAERDIAIFKEDIKHRSPEELIASFITSTSDARYGGYEYFYSFMANHAIKDELRSRKASAIPALEANVDDDTILCEAINGPPGNTIGNFCKELLEDLKQR